MEGGRGGVLQCSIDRLPTVCRFAVLLLLHSLANQNILYQALSNLSPGKQSPLSPHYSSIPPSLLLVAA